MRIPPGQNIPFWLRLWDGTPNRFCQAHLTDTFGVEQPGSPYPLTYSGNRGIYTGVGPPMGRDILVSDYEVFFDSGYTQLDTAHLPGGDWILPDVGPPPQLILINKPLKAIINPTRVLGTIACEVQAQAKIQRDKLIGIVSIPNLSGTVSIPEANL